MRLLFLGDVLGRSGRTAISEHMPDLRDRLKPDFIAVNAENSAAGFGMTDKIAGQLIQAGADAITGGNHSFDQRDVMAAMDRDERLLRPVNYPDGTPGRGFTVFTTVRGKKIGVINAMGRVFMNPLECPFRAIDNVLDRLKLAATVDAIMVDFHGEATSEKMAMGHYLDGRVSMVVGTHSHVPTADAQILPGGTAYQTDAGMCGDYNSVIGMEKEEPINRFLTRMNKERYTPAMGPATVCGVFVETDDKTGLAKRIDPVRIGGRLQENIPSL